MIQNESLPGQVPKEQAFNIFILPKKYPSVQDVRLKDIYDAFPDGDQYHLRFEQVVMLR
jgi:hypothetical protein